MRGVERHACWGEVLEREGQTGGLPLVVSGGRTLGDWERSMGLVCSGLENHFPLLWWPVKSFPLSLSYLFSPLLIHDVL